MTSSRFRLILILLMLSATLVLVVSRSRFLQSEDTPELRELDVAPKGLQLQGSWSEKSCDYVPQLGIRIECYWYFSGRQQSGFKMPVVVFLAAGPNARQDPLVYLSGGPGVGGTTGSSSLAYWEQWLQQISINRDLVLLDFRALEPGEPNWDCQAYIDASKQLLQHDLSFDQESEVLSPILAECFEGFNSHLRQTLQAGPEGDGPVPENLVAQFNSSRNADDVAAILRFLGYKSWNFLASSYGTRVALIAAQSQEEVRRVILDSPYPPGEGGLDSAPVLWVSAFSRFWQICDAGIACAEPVASSESLFWSVMARLKAEPIKITVEDWSSGRDVTWLLNDARLAAVLYGSFYRSDLLRYILPALVGLKSRDVRAAQYLLEIFYNQLFDPTFNNMVFYATECNDNKPISEQRFDQALNETGPWRAYFRRDWDFDVCRHPLFQRGAVPNMRVVEQPTLVVAGQYDPITTVDHAQNLMKWLPKGFFLALPGRAHAEFDADGCGATLIPWFLNKPINEIEQDWKNKRSAC